MRQLRIEFIPPRFFSQIPRPQEAPDVAKEGFLQAGYGPKRLAGHFPQRKGIYIIIYLCIYIHICIYIYICYY